MAEYDRLALLSLLRLVLVPLWGRYIGCDGSSIGEEEYVALVVYDVYLYGIGKGRVDCLKGAQGQEGVRVVGMDRGRGLDEVGDGLLGEEGRGRR